MGEGDLIVMDSIQQALKEDNRTAGAFLLSLPGLLLCVAGIHYTPARIFYYEKFSGTSLPMLAVFISFITGVEMRPHCCKTDLLFASSSWQSRAETGIRSCSST